MKKSIKLTIGFIIIGCFLIGSFTFFLTRNDITTTYVQKVNTEFENMQIAQYDTEILLSSNPYDYIENEYYENIVSLGFPAVSALEYQIDNGDLPGQYQYVAAIAIQEITGCDLFTATGIDWSNVNEFRELWNTTISELPETIEKIVNDSEVDTDNKIEKIQKYGIFSKSFLENAANETSVNFSNSEADAITYNFNEDEISKCEKALETISEYEIDSSAIMEYIESKRL